MMNVRALHTKRDYDWALKEVERYFDHIPKPGTKQAERFDVLSALIKEYEERTMKMPDADPIEVLHFAIESMGKTQADLSRIIGEPVAHFRNFKQEKAPPNPPNDSRH
jgi:HTH-type transcriptional regulator / antitoxin HigA